MKRSDRRAQLRSQQPPAEPTTIQVRDGYANFLSRVGHGTENQSSGGTYGMQFFSLNRQLMENAYKGSWICAKAVDAVAEDATKRGIEITGPVEPDEIEKLMVSWKRLKIWDRLCDTIRWSRLFGGSVAVMLLDGQDLSTPLRIQTVGKGQFKGLLVLDRWVCSAVQNDPIRELGPDLGLPKFYEVQADNQALAHSRIHHSRVIRLEGQSLPYYAKLVQQGWGASVLEKLWDRLTAFDSTTQGIAQLIFKAHLRTLKVEDLREVMAAGGPAMESVLKQVEVIRTLQTNEGLTLLDGTDEYETHSFTFAGLDSVLMQFAQQLAGALDIPLTKLFGQSPAGLNSTGESDLENYYSSIEQQQENKLRSGVEKILAVSYQSLFGTPLPEGVDFNFRPLWQMSDKEKAELASTVATAVTNVEASGIIDRATALKELRQSSRITGIFSNISDEDIKEAEAEPPPMPEMSPAEPEAEPDAEEQK